MQRREQERDIGGSVRHAGGGEGDEEGSASGGGWRERVGSAERTLLAAVVQTVILGPVGGNADAGDDDVGGAAGESQGSFAVFGVEDVAFRDGEVGVDGGLRGAFFEKEGGEFGGSADDCCVVRG